MLGTSSAAQELDSSSNWELVAYERQQRRVFRLPSSGVVTIGRAALSDVRLDDDSVSREHARLHVASFEIEDLDSRNGSWVMESGLGSSMPPAAAGSGLRLSAGVRQRIAPGAVLKLGAVQCQIQQSAPVIHTMPVPPARDDADQPVLEDPSMVELYALAERMAGTLLPLLILGETGVGKDVLAARVHHASPRRKGPFVRINCGALSESLLESELFGHQRGAFTGANDNKPGLFEVGNGGTVFLDEIGELPLRTQVKLLHVLETSQVTRVGATKAQRIDVRFIAATNREIARDVQAGTFRKDLYFRINTLCLKINPLRERRADILPLVRHFLQRTCASMGTPIPELLPATLEHLQQYSWPGNVRELKNAVERARLLCGHGPILPQHFPTERELLNAAPDLTDLWADAEAPTMIKQRSELEVDSAGSRARSSSPHDAPSSGPHSGPSTSHVALIEALNACGGNQTRAAERLGISRRTLVNRLNEFNLPRPRKGRT